MSVSVMVRKCVSAIYHASSYSYFTDDLGDTDAHRCPSPLDIVHSRPKDKWGRVILLVRSRCHLWRKAFCWRGRNTKISGLLTANVIPGRRRTAYPPFSPEHRQPQAEEQKKKNHRQVTRAEQENDNNHIKREEGGKAYGSKGRDGGKSSKGQGATWRRIERNNRSWRAYGTTFRDDEWNNPRIREGHRDWGKWDDQDWSNVDQNNDNWEEYDQN